MADRRTAAARRVRRLTRLVAAGLGVAGVLSAASLAALKVFADTTQLALTTPVLTSQAGQRIYRDYDVVVEPYKDVIRTGYRVRPRAGQETGTITTSDLDCVRNPVANDVVCSKFSTSIAINLRNSGDDDRVAIREYVVRTDLPGLYECVRRSSLTNVTASVYLGGGDDRFEDISSSVQCPAGEDDSLGATIPPNAAVNRPFGLDLASIEVSGEGGDDEIVLDALSRAVLEASGGSGADRIVSRRGNDEADGGSGNDELDLGDGNDRGIGGSGNDAIEGRDGDDVVQGQDGDDELFGGSGNDSVDGGLGNDTLSGGAGIDQLRAGPGSDVVNAGDGDDVVWLDDDNTQAVPTPDEANCGTGRDVVYADAVDNAIGCEEVYRHWYTDGLPGYVTNDAVTIPANGSFSLQVRCPSQAGVRCTGTLTLRVPGTSAVLGQATYDLGLGQSATRTFQIPGTAPATIVAHTSEQGQTQPRSASITLAVS